MKRINGINAELMLDKANFDLADQIRDYLSYAPDDVKSSMHLLWGVISVKELANYQKTNFWDFVENEALRNSEVALAELVKNCNAHHIKYVYYYRQSKDMVILSAVDFKLVNVLRNIYDNHLDSVRDLRFFNSVSVVLDALNQALIMNHLAIKDYPQANKDNPLINIQHADKLLAKVLK